MTDRTRLPRWLWLWFPPVLAVVVIGSRLLAPDWYQRVIEPENGLIELATPLVSLLGFGVGLAMLRHLYRIPSRLMRAWVVALTFACLYLAGEELSWGQQLFKWETPQEMAVLNDQNETNLHNMSSWFDQKPRLLLELWVLIGGIMVPLRRRLRGGRGPALFWRWFWPSWECVPTAILAIAIKLPERYRDVVGAGALPFEIRWSEPQEYYFALFLLIYLLAVNARMHGHPTRT